MYEPKWDGFRALIHVTTSGARIKGRKGGSLGGRFPEVCARMAELVGPGTILDGEIVAMRGGVLDFSALLSRAVEQPPAIFVGFDLLIDANEDVRGHSLADRRRRLEATLPESEVTCVTPQTDDIEIAERWIEDLPSLGLEGVVAKQASGRYRSGKRGWVKVRRFDTLDAVVGGYRTSRDRATALLLGLFDGRGRFRYIGQTTSLPEQQRERVARVLETLTTDESFTGRLLPGTTRWEKGGVEDWVAIEPVLVCEVSYSRIDDGFLRHPARIVRWRPDKDAKDCTVQA